MVAFKEPRVSMEPEDSTHLLAGHDGHQQVGACRLVRALREEARMVNVGWGQFPAIGLGDKVAGREIKRNAEDDLLGFICGEEEEDAVWGQNGRYIGQHGAEWRGEFVRRRAEKDHNVGSGEEGNQAIRNEKAGQTIERREGLGEGLQAVIDSHPSDSARHADFVQSSCGPRDHHSRKFQRLGRRRRQARGRISSIRRIPLEDVYKGCLFFPPVFPAALDRRAAIEAVCACKLAQTQVGTLRSSLIPGCQRRLAAASFVKAALVCSCGESYLRAPRSLWRPVAVGEKVVVAVVNREAEGRKKKKKKKKKRTGIQRLGTGVGFSREQRLLSLPYYYYYYHCCRCHLFCSACPSHAMSSSSSKRLRLARKLDRPYFAGLTAEARFGILNKIGEGTFSTVRLAKSRATADDPTMEPEKFAVKMLHAYSAPDRIAAEVKYLRQLGGQHSVTALLRGFRREDEVMLVFPHYDHIPFKESYLSFTLFHTRLYMYHLLEALAHIHAAKVVHRDVKPSNFLSNVHTRVFALIDFGLAHDESEAVSQLKDLVASAAEQGRKRNRDGSVASGHSSSSSTSASAVVAASATSGPSASLKMPAFALHVIHPHSARHLADGAGLGHGAADIQQHGNSFPHAGASKNAKLVAASQAAAARRPASSSSSAVLSKLLPGTPPGALPTQTPSSIPVLNKSSGVFVSAGVLDDRPSCHIPRQGTRGFRPPEVLFHCTHPLSQTTKIDIWAAGVILLSIATGRYPFFSSPDDLSSLAEIHALVGTEPLMRAAQRLNVKMQCHPHNRTVFWPERIRQLRRNLYKTGMALQEACDPDLCDLLSQLLEPDPVLRISAKDALNHRFFHPVFEERSNENLLVAESSSSQGSGGN